MRFRDSEGDEKQIYHVAFEHLYTLVCFVSSQFQSKSAYNEIYRQVHGVCPSLSTTPREFEQDSALVPVEHGKSVGCPNKEAE